MAWQVDPTRTSLTFEIRNLGLDVVRGVFDDFAVALRAPAGDAPFLAFDLRIQAGSLATGNPERDAKLTGPDFLDAARYPLILFVADRLEPLPDFLHSLAKLHGDLRLRDETRPVEWRIELNSSAEHSNVETEAVFVDTLEIEPAEWGIGHHIPLVGPKLKLILRFIAIDAGEFDITPAGPPPNAPPSQA